MSVVRVASPHYICSVSSLRHTKTTMVKAKIKSTKKSAKKAVKKGKGSNSTNCHFGKANPYNYSETLAARKQKSQKTKAKGYGKKKKAISYQNYSNTTRHRKKPLKPKLSANFPRNSFVMDENTPWFKTSMGGMKSSNVSNRRQSPCYFEEIDLTKLQQLSKELVKFHGYCTLREVEVNARRYIMSSIEKLCQEQWGSGSFCFVQQMLLARFVVTSNPFHSLTELFA